MFPLLAAKAAHANEFPDFVVKNAMERGFKSCNKAIRKAFSLVNGEDIRVITNDMPKTKTDSLKITAVYGKTADSAYIEAEFRKIGLECAYTSTIIMAADKSCVAYFGEMSDAFKFKAETAGTIFAENAGGANMFLTPAENSCVVVVQTDGMQPAN